MDNLGTVPNNGAENFNSGRWPLPEPACASEADGPGIMAALASTSSESAPAVGGNDGDE